MLLFGVGSGEQVEAWQTWLSYAIVRNVTPISALTGLTIDPERKSIMSDVSPEFGQAIRQIRDERGMTRKAVISQLPGDRPMTERTLLRYEDGQTKAPGEFFLDFEKAVDVPYGTVTRTAAEICGEEIPPYPLPQQVQGFVEDEDGNLKPEHEAWQAALRDSVGRAPSNDLALTLYEAMAGRRLAGTLGQSLADRVGRYFDALDHEILGAGLPAARLARDLITELDRLIQDDEVLQRHFTTVRDAGEEGEIILALLQLLRRLAKDPWPKVEYGRLDGP